MTIEYVRPEEIEALEMEFERIVQKLRDTRRGMVQEGIDTIEVQVATIRHLLDTRLTAWSTKIYSAFEIAQAEKRAAGVRAKLEKNSGRQKKGN